MVGRGSQSPSDLPGFGHLLSRVVCFVPFLIVLSLPFKISLSVSLSFAGRTGAQMTPANTK